MKIYIIAGEASGDLHASNLIKALKAESPEIEFRGWGGDLMQEAGMDMVKHYKNTAVMGLINVLLKLRSIKRNMEFCKQDIVQWQPDLLIFVDYPGFNLRIAAFTKSLGLTNYFYIAPKVWASREKRIKNIKRYVDKIFAILPFEERYFKTHNIIVEYVGNPVVDALAMRECKNEQKNDFIKRTNLSSKPIIALLAGSRLHEVTQILPYFMRMIDDYPDYQFVIAGVSVIKKHVYADIIGSKDVKLIFDDTYALLQHAHLALVASGTATLETALLNVPQVVCYRLWGKYLTQFVMNQIVKVPYVSLVNLILGREAVPELIQIKLTDKALKAHLHKLVYDEDTRRRMFNDYNELNKILGNERASVRAAKQLLKSFKHHDEVKA